MVLTELHLAAKAGDTEEAAKIIDNQENVNEKGAATILDEQDCTGWTAMHWASSRGRNEMVKLLVEKGANPNVVTPDQWAPVHDAARNGSEQVLRILKEAGAEMHAKTEKGNSPLHFACKYGKEHAAAYLIDCEADGVDINGINDLKHSALHVAAANGHEAIVTLLVEKRAKTLLLDRIGRNPEALARANGHQTVAGILKAAAEFEKESVIDSANICMNNGEELEHSNDKAGAAVKYEEAAVLFQMADDVENAKKALDLAAQLKSSK